LLTILFVAYKLRLRNLKAQKKALEQLVSDRTNNIAMLSDIGKELTSSLDINDVIELLYRSVNKVLPADVFLLGILQEDSQQIFIPKAIENGNVLPAKILPLSEKKSPAVWCVKHKKEVIINNLNDQLKYFEQADLVPKQGGVMQSVIYQPLIVGKNTIGCLSIQNREEHAFNEQHIDMIRTLASYTSIALDNAQGYNKLEIAHKSLGKALEELEEISLTDQLTGAHNRRFLEKFIAFEIAKVKRSYFESKDNTAFSLGFLMIDADHFKQVNDDYGHHAGDLVLKQLVSVIKDTCRESDWVIRWGGEEFLVVSVGLQKEKINTLAERIRINIAKHHFDIGNGQTIEKTCSIGISSFPFVNHDIDALTWEQTLNLSDIALYTAKESGRDSWVHLFESNIVNYDSFYNDIIDFPQQQVNQGVISFDSSVDKELVNFRAN
jgi:diguanylate cyclase (GGDEF)-like protein